MAVPAARLEDYVAAIFRAAGSAAGEAGLIAHHLVASNLAGHDSHGVGLVRGYLAAVARGDLRLNHRLAVMRDSGSVLVCDGGNGAGAAMASAAMDLGIARTRREGAAIVALRDSYHIGRIGAWAEQCAAAGLVSIHFVNVPAHAAVAAFGGTKARLGTNPFAAGFPCGEGEPVIVDFATSRWAVGKVQVARRANKRVPPGILLDAEGRETDDPAALFAAPPGALLPFGEHKGFGLALACEMLAGALLGAETQRGEPSPAITNSMLSVILDPGALGGEAAYAERRDALLAWVTSERGEGKEIMLPGEPERMRRARLLGEGLALDAGTRAELAEAAASVGVDAASHLGDCA
ncbi:malate/lactate/ureidoglycolate dehydrogenase [Elioraea rosea]|uniref:malate/lactate/ureidoglycolate dehydrogenase n=1 Tax=Elioraea rosea TaxID=2492390 RepID=UPI0011829E5B|nr:malate/lactate/ureidoglycolate dehydrogenase [Elioraea rosea]